MRYTKMEKESETKSLVTKDVSGVVEDIVHKWNEMVIDLQNTTIRICLMIQETLKDFPEETIKDILNKVKTHPDIKQFVSIDRIWQGMRLVNRRPDIISFGDKSDEEKNLMDFKKKPYLKKDGEIFWEFYFELEKAPFNQLTKEMLELEGKKDLWSFRELRRQIQDKKDELSLPHLSLEAKQLKCELIKQISGMIRGFDLSKLRDAKKLLEALQKQNLEEKKVEENE